MKSKYHHKLTVFIVLYISFSSCLFSQDPPITWGDIPRAELEMTSFPGDTNASAVILCDYGDSYLSERYKNIFRRHTRIKILTSKGYPLGTHSFIIYTNWKNEGVQDFEGITYSLNDQGEVVEEEIGRKDILTKDIDSQRRQYWFTMPALKPGCIIEFRYMISSKSIAFRNWTFQYNEPVLWSEYRVLFPRKFGFSAVHQGNTSYAIHENKVILSKLHYSVPTECTQMRWAVQNAPAMRDEPYMSSTNDYVKKVTLQISGFAIPGFHVGDILNDWSSAIKEILEYDEFENSMDGTRKVKELANQITTGLALPNEKMNAIYSWVTKSILQSGVNTMYTQKEVDDVIQTRTGNSTEINFLLLSLLKSVGIDADPIILSTRDNGKVLESYPLLSQFNYLIVRARPDSEFVYLDATESFRPLILLPEKILNTRGLVVKKDTVEWVKLASTKKYSNISAAYVSLQKDASLSGTLEDMYRDYGALEMRNSLKKKKDVDIAKELFETEDLGLLIDSVSVDGKDSIDLPLKIKASISSTDYAQLNGDLIYFNPHILHRISENPLKTEKRNFPLDYSYQREFSAIVNITIPDSFEVHESVVSRNLIVGPNYALFSRRVVGQGNQIRVQYKWEIRETEIDTMYYAQMRDLYAQIIAIESEQFVFARMKQPEVTSPKSPPAVNDPSKAAAKPRKKGEK